MLVTITVSCKTKSNVSLYISTTLGLKHLLNETILNKSFSLDPCSVEKISICSGLYLAVWLCPVTFL